MSIVKDGAYSANRRHRVAVSTAVHHNGPMRHPLMFAAGLWAERDLCAGASRALGKCAVLFGGGQRLCAASPGGVSRGCLGTLGPREGARDGALNARNHGVTAWTRHAFVEGASPLECMGIEERTRP